MVNDGGTQQTARQADLGGLVGAAKRPHVPSTLQAHAQRLNGSYLGTGND